MTKQRIDELCTTGNELINRRSVEGLRYPGITGFHARFNGGNFINRANCVDILYQ